MSHTIRILDYKPLSNGQFAILTQCCDEALQMSWHTMDASVLVDEVKHKESLDAHFAMVAAHHEASIHAEDRLKRLVGSIREVTNVRSQ